MSILKMNANKKTAELCDSCEYAYYNKCVDGCDVNCKCHDLDDCYCSKIKIGEICRRYKQRNTPSKNPLNRRNWS